jgi:hypothetical protein
MEPGHRRARERGRDGGDGATVGTGDRLGGVDHAPAAERHERRAP